MKFWLRSNIGGKPRSFKKSDLKSCKPWRVHQAGFPNVVALMGSALSRAQQKLLLDHFEELVLMVEGDETGRRASRRIAAQLPIRIPLRAVEVPGPAPRRSQPDSVILLRNTLLPATMDDAGSRQNLLLKRIGFVDAN